MAFIRRIKCDGNTELQLENKQLTFGRSPSNDVCVDKYAGISRHHCGFTKYEDGIVTLTDNGSRNGTFVNGEKIFEETPLKHRDEIIICEELQFIFMDFDSDAGKKELAEEEKQARKEKELKKKTIVVKGDDEMSDAMRKMSNEMEEGKDFKSMMDEILKPTKKKSAPPNKPASPKKDDDPEKWVNTYEEINIKRR